MKKSQAREKMIIYANNLALKQRQADVFNEIHRAEGMLSNHIPLVQREYLSKNRDALRKTLGTAALPE